MASLKPSTLVSVSVLVLVTLFSTGQSVCRFTASNDASKVIDLSEIEGDEISLGGHDNYEYFWTPCTNGFTCDKDTGSSVNVMIGQNRYESGTSFDTCYTVSYMDDDVRPTYDASNEAFVFYYHNGDDVACNGGTTRSAKIIMTCGSTNSYTSSWRASEPSTCSYEFDIQLQLACITTNPTKNPAKSPTGNPTKRPSAKPTQSPTTKPTPNPSKRPSDNPSEYPSQYPTLYPTLNPTEYPTPLPTTNPTSFSTEHPTQSPATLSPTANPIEIESDSVKKGSGNSNNMTVIIISVCGSVLVCCLAVCILIYCRRDNRDSKKHDFAVAAIEDQPVDEDSDDDTTPMQQTDTQVTSVVTDQTVSMVDDESDCEDDTLTSPIYKS